MKRVFIQGAVAIGLFLLSWLLLNQIDFIKIFDLRTKADWTQKKAVKIIRFPFKDKEIKQAEIVAPVDSIFNSLCRENSIDPKQYQLQVINEKDVNAFALPFNNIVIHSGLIAECKSQEELAGVIAHELAHNILNHVSKKMVKEFGIAFLSNLTDNGITGEMAKEILKTYSSNAYDQELENQADQLAVVSLLEAKIDPQPFAEFLKSLDEKNLPTFLNWTSTHPSGTERAKRIALLLLSKKPQTFKKTISEKTWLDLKKAVEKL